MKWQTESATKKWIQLLESLIKHDEKELEAFQKLEHENHEEHIYEGRIEAYEYLLNLVKQNTKWEGK